MRNHTEREALIQKFPCFTSLTAAEILQLANLGEDVTYKTGAIITVEGDPVDSVYLIATGTAEVFINKGENKERQLVAVLRPGESIGLGDFGLYSKTGLRTATVIATSSMQLIRFPIEKFNQFFSHHPQPTEVLSKTALKMRLIKNSLPFTTLSNEHLTVLLQRIKERSVEAGEILFKTDEKIDRCYAILSGKVEIFITDTQGKKTVLAELTNNAVFGEGALISSVTRNVSARAIENSKFLVLKKNDFMALIAKEAITADTLTLKALEYTTPIANHQVAIYQHKTADTADIITLKNLITNSYYQLSEEGWFIYQNLNGKNTPKKITDLFYKTYNILAPDFIYDLVGDLIDNGFAFYSEEKQLDLARISVLSYGPNGFYKVSGVSFEDTLATPKEETTWINIDGLNNIDLIKKIANQYNLHPLTIGEILNTEQPARFDDFPEYDFMILKLVSYDEKNITLASEQISICLGKNYILSFQEKESQLIDDISYRLNIRREQRLLTHGPDYLAYLLIDKIINKYITLLDNIGVDIEKLEDELLKKPTQKIAQQLYRYKRLILEMQKLVRPMRDILNHLMHESTGVVTPFAEPYYKDAYDHANQVMDMIDSLRSTLAGMLDIYLSSLSNRTNEIIRVLTIFSVSFIPLTFITGYFGMNLAIPGLHSPWTVYLATGIMLMIVGGMLIYFKRKHWF